MTSRAGTFGTRAIGIVLLGLALLAPRTAAAQAVTGTILGTVKDSTGAVLAGAKVTVTNEGTGFTRTVTTDAAGEYTVPQIPTGKLYRAGGDGRLQGDRPLEHRTSASTSACASTSGSKSAR